LLIIATLGMAVLALVAGGYAMVLDRRVDEMRRERDAAIVERYAAERALIVLEDQHFEELARKTEVTAGKEAIRELDVSNDPPVAESLRRGLQTADEIGGLK